MIAKLKDRLTLRPGALQGHYLGKGHSTEAYRACPLYMITVEGDELGMEGVWQFALSDQCGFRSMGL